MSQVDFDSCRNFYEKLVFQQVLALYGQSALAAVPGALEDIACLALNQLPARYIRYQVDASFYMATEEEALMIAAVEEAVNRAALHVSGNPRGPGV
jgi:hypothetical protein